MIKLNRKNIFDSGYPYKNESYAFSGHPNNPRHHSSYQVNMFYAGETHIHNCICQPPTRTHSLDITGVDNAEELASVILETKLEPLLSRYPLLKKQKGEIANHPYRKELQKKHRNFIQQIRQATPDIKIKGTLDIGLSAITLILPRKFISELRRLWFVKEIHRDRTMTIDLGRETKSNDSRNTIFTNDIDNLETINVLATRQMTDDNGSPLDGSGVKIAVIDTGINGFDQNVIDRYNFNDNTQDISDNNGHGTMVTEIILSVAPKCSILGYKITNGTKSTVSAALHALDKAVENKADIINLSQFASAIPIHNPHDPLDAMILNIAHADILVVMGMGNNGTEWRVHSATATPEVIAVGATSYAIAYGKTTVAPYSNRGPVPGTWIIKPDVVAPGTYKNRTGTSIATPYVCGSIALVKQKHRDWNSSEVKSSLATTATLLTERDNPMIAPCSAQGSGLLNVFNAISSTIQFSRTTINFEPVDTRLGINTQKNELYIRNQEKIPMNYHLHWEWNQDDTSNGLIGEISPPSIVLQPKEFIGIGISLTTNTTARSGLHSGNIVITTRPSNRLDEYERLVGPGYVDKYHLPILVMVEPVGYPLLVDVKMEMVQPNIYEVIYHVPFRMVNLNVEITYLNPESHIKEKFIPLGSFLVTQGSKAVNLSLPELEEKTGRSFKKGTTYFIEIYATTTPTTAGYIVGQTFAIPFTVT